MMLGKLALFLSLTVFTSSVLANNDHNLHRRTGGGGGGGSSNCAKGTYSANGKPPCKSCAAGSYSKESSAKTCTLARPGYYIPTTGATSETPCRAGTYVNTSGATKCLSCPAGFMCPSDAMHTPQQCSPGRYSTGGVTNCPLCPAGSFNNIHKATSCCPCPAGWFLGHPGNVNCQQCPNQTPYSNPGADSMNKCSSKKGSYAPAKTATQGADGTCPPSHPVPSGHPKRHVPRSNCKFGQRACPIYKGLDVIDYDCIDIKTDLVSCGGCVIFTEQGPTSLDGGRDCSAIPFVNEVSCDNGKCKIGSCAHGYTLSGDSCIPFLQLNTGSKN